MSTAKLVFFVSLLLPVFNSASAEVRATVKAQYKADYGMSQSYSLSASLITGQELNQATRTFNYDSFRLYVVLWFGEGQAAVIKVQEQVIVGAEFTESHFQTTRIVHSKLSGFDQDGTYWEVCISQLGYCF